MAVRKLLPATLCGASPTNLLRRWLRSGTHREQAADEDEPQRSVRLLAPRPLMHHMGKVWNMRMAFVECRMLRSVAPPRFTRECRLTLTNPLRMGISKVLFVIKNGTPMNVCVNQNSGSRYWSLAMGWTRSFRIVIGVER